MDALGEEGEVADLHHGVDDLGGGVVGVRVDVELGTSGSQLADLGELRSHMGPCRGAMAGTLHRSEGLGAGVGGGGATREVQRPTAEQAS